MSVTTGYAPERYAGDGAQTVFEIPWPFIRADQVRVTRTTGGVDILLAEGADYTVTPGAGVGGTFTMAEPPEDGATLTVWREMPLEQPDVYPQTGVFDLKTAERGFDRLTMLVQQVAEGVGRAVKVAITSGTSPDRIMDDINAALQGAQQAAGQAGDNAALAETARAGAEDAREGAEAAQARAEGAREGGEAARDEAQLALASVAQAVADARQDVLASAAFVPIGAILDFPVNTVPVGFLVCAGQVVTRAAYPDLVTYLTGGTVAVNATLPDLRGEFRRGADMGRGVDAGRVVGSAQGDAIRNITGSLPNYFTDNATRDGGVLKQAAQSGLSQPFGAGTALAWSTLSIDASRQVPTASENRPRNIAVVPCIKAYHAPMSAAPVDLTAVLEHLDALAAVFSPEVGRFCTVQCAVGSQVIPVAGATVVAAQGGLSIAAGENWSGPSDGSLSITVPSDGVYDIRGTLSGSVSASGQFGTWITINGVAIPFSYVRANVTLMTTGYPACTLSLKAGDVVRMSVSTSVQLTSEPTGKVTLTARRVR